jgi:hypothetical protein
MKIIISERQYKLLTENIPEIDSIIDKISSVGFNNLNDDEKEKFAKSADAVRAMNGDLKSILG